MRSAARGRPARRARWCGGRVRYRASATAATLGCLVLALPVIGQSRGTSAADAATAQRSAGGPLAAPTWLRPSSEPLRPDLHGGLRYPQRRAVSPGGAVLLSAVVPGGGQLLSGQKRGWAYLALETVGWALWVDRRSAGGDLVRAYRDFAWERARIQSGARVEGDFDYYETLTKWTRSGAFDTDAGTTGLQPESDPATFNGMIWQRAVAIYLPGGGATPPTDPAWERALDYYRARAYPTELLWDWSGTGDDRDTYGGILADSDAKYRQATNVLGAIIANHLLSAVDAYLSTRGVPTPAELSVVPGAAGGRGPRWHARMRLAVGR